MINIQSTAISTVSNVNLLTMCRCFTFVILDTACALPQPVLRAFKHLLENIRNIFRTEESSRNSSVLYSDEDLGKAQQWFSNHFTDTSCDISSDTEDCENSGNSDFSEKAKERRVSDGVNFACVVCFTHIKNIVLLPCKHLCVCEPCVHKIRKMNSRCPMCKKYIESLIKVYI